MPKVLDKDEIENFKWSLGLIEHITQNYDNPIDRNNEITWKDGVELLFTFNVNSTLGYDEI